jgi:hypothetical protein
MSGCAAELSPRHCRRARGSVATQYAVACVKARLHVLRRFRCFEPVPRLRCETRFTANFMSSFHSRVTRCVSRHITRSGLKTKGILHVKKSDILTCSDRVCLGGLQGRSVHSTPSRGLMARKPFQFPYRNSFGGMGQPCLQRSKEHCLHQIKQT